MFSSVLKKIFGTRHERDMKKLSPVVDQINSLEKDIQKLTDEELKSKTGEFKRRLSNGENLDSLLNEAFAVCREASVRTLGLRHYNVQLIGGMILHSGAIAEMKTGEGKTLVATLPCYLNALEGKGVHVVTVNDYLAQRDREWMGKVHQFLGFNTGAILHHLTDAERKVAYAQDITYGTNNEFGFDYLRDNMKFDLDDYVQRELNYAIVDECDSILIDESRTPLIISGPAEKSTEKYQEINKVIPHFEKEKHFTTEEKTKTVSLTEEGNAHAESLLKIGNLYDAQNIQTIHYIYQGLRAHHLYQKDVDYMVKDGEIIIVDEFTGRLMPGRRWSEGLHQAIEAKEGVSIQGENQTLASITFQNYFRMYNKLSGMTGTAETEEVEFQKIYNLGVSVIPTHEPIRRKDHDDIVYKTELVKFKAITEDIKERAKKGQPVLVGTVSIEKSEKISQYLRKNGIPHNVLNAKYHEKEAEIIAQAGRKGAITIATNMAGRGTDIILGGNPEFLATSEGKKDANEPSYKKDLEEYGKKCQEEKKHVIENGGLYIVGTERHESRRIDNQLRGRSGRQGDPGESRFYLSLEDKLMVTFNGEKLQKIMTTLNVPEEEPIVSGMVTRAIEGAQRKVEGYQFDVRKHLLEYDDVMNQQRKNIYGLRREVLSGKNAEKLTLGMVGEVVSDLLDVFIPEGSKTEDWDLEGLERACKHQFETVLSFGDKNNLSDEDVTKKVKLEVKKSFDRKKEEIKEHFEEVQKMLLLQVIDHLWREHLASMDQLREGINLRAYAQKDPLIEYKKESFQAFDHMTQAMRSEYIEKLMKIQISKDEVKEAWEQQQKQDLSNLDMTHEEYANLVEEYKKKSEEDLKNANYLHSGGGGGEGDERKLNRAQRRRLEKQRKRKRR